MKYIMVISLFLFVLAQRSATADFNSCKDDQEISTDRIKVKDVDMPTALMYEALETASQGLELFKDTREVADFIKIEFDRYHGSPWQCFVRRGGSSGISTYLNSESSISFDIDSYSIILYRTKELGTVSESVTKNSDYSFSSDNLIHEDNVVFIKVDLPGTLKNDAVKIAQNALNFFKDPERIARYIREFYNEEHEAFWQCFVFTGKEPSGFSVTANKNHFIYFKIQDFWVLLFKTNAQ